MRDLLLRYLVAMAINLAIVGVRLAPPARAWRVPWPIVASALHTNRRLPLIATYPAGADGPRPQPDCGGRCIQLTNRFIHALPRAGHALPSLN